MYGKRYEVNGSNDMVEFDLGNGTCKCGNQLGASGRYCSKCEKKNNQRREGKSHKGKFSRADRYNN